MHGHFKRVKHCFLCSEDTLIQITPVTHSLSMYGSLPSHRKLTAGALNEPLSCLSSRRSTKQGQLDEDRPVCGVLWRGRGTQAEKQNKERQQTKGRERYV